MLDLTGVTVPDTMGIRLQTAAGTPSFDSEGQVQGRLEVFHDGQWGTVCDDYFGEPDAQVACRQLGNELGYTLTSWSVVGSSNVGGPTPSGTGQIWLNDVSCGGTDTSLSDCNHAGWGGPRTDDCTHQEDAGVSCTFLAPGDECEECVAGKLSGTIGIGGFTSWAGGSLSTVGSGCCPPVFCPPPPPSLPPPRTKTRCR
jgi:hypothetical protein